MVRSLLVPRLSESRALCASRRTTLSAVGHVPLGKLLARGMEAAAAGR